MSDNPIPSETSDSQRPSPTPTWLWALVGGVVLVLKSVEVPVPLFAVHQGLPELRDRPHALTRLVSWTAATPDWSETRFA